MKIEYWFTACIRNTTGNFRFIQIRIGNLIAFGTGSIKTMNPDAVCGWKLKTLKPK